jgi:hypothetical protein
MSNLLSAEDVSKVNFGDSIGRMIANGVDVSAVCVKLREALEQAIYRIKKMYNQRFALVRNRMAARRQELERRGMDKNAVAAQIKSEFAHEMRVLMNEQNAKIENVRLMIRTIVDETVRRFAKIEP